MISTSRGLSAVRPPSHDDLSTGTGAPWSSGLWPAGHQMPAVGLPPAGLSAGGRSPARTPAGTEVRLGDDADAPAPSAEPQLPVEGSASTATTSAVAV